MYSPSNTPLICQLTFCVTIWLERIQLAENTSSDYQFNKQYITHHRQICIIINTTCNDLNIHF